MSYFKQTPINKKASSIVDEVFSIFLHNNDSSDDMEIHDNVIAAIKTYYKITEFTEDHVQLLEKILGRVFKEPNVPNIVKDNKVNVQIKQRDNKFKQKYKL